MVPIELTQGGMEFENYSFFYKFWTSDMNIFSFEASYFPWNSYFPWDSAGFYLLVLGISSVIFAIINFSIINKCIGCVAFLFLGFALFDFYEIANFDSPRYVYGWELGTGWVILFLGAILNFFSVRKEWTEWLEDHLKNNKSNIVALTGGLLLITAFFLTVIVVSRDRIYDESTSTDVSFFPPYFLVMGGIIVLLRTYRYPCGL